jgi:hypothetical protein
MKNWFSQFEECLNGEKAPADLIGAGTADSDRAMAHYRYQHISKMKEAVEVTFPVLLRYLGNDWQETWESFWKQNEVSLRNLDWFPEVFMNYFLTTNAPIWQKELTRFEHHMDIHPWTNKVLTLNTSFVLDESSKVILGNYEILSFKAPVTELYNEDEISDKDESQMVLLWQKEDGIYFRVMKEWEQKVLTTLDQGVENALEHAPEDPEAVGEFFKWLGSSCLIQGLKQD